MLSTEAIHAVQALKFAKSTSKLGQVLHTRIRRLLKADAVAALAELQRQNEWDIALKVVWSVLVLNFYCMGDISLRSRFNAKICDLLCVNCIGDISLRSCFDAQGCVFYVFIVYALQVFEFMRKEMLYQPDASLYADMILLVGKNKMVGVAEELFGEMEREGLEHNARVYTEMIGAYFHVGMVEKAIKMYGVMKESGCMPDKLAFAILINGLEKAREEELACSVKKEFRKYLDDLAI